VVGTGGVEVLEHLGSEHAEGGVAGDTSGVDDRLGHASLAETGLAETEDVAVFLDEAAVEQLANDSWLELGAGCEVESLEPFDGAEARAVQASGETAAVAG